MNAIDLTAGNDFNPHYCLMSGNGKNEQGIE